MIQKILRGKGFAGLIAYISGPGKSGDDNRAELLFAQNLSSDSPKEFASDLRSIAAARPEIERPVIHAVLRLAPGESLTNEQWRSVATEYMQRMGYGNAPFVVYRHHDITNGDHIHIAGSRVDSGAELVSNSYERQRGRLVVRDLERRLNLVQTRDAAGERAPSANQYHAEQRTLQGSRRVELQGLIREASKGNPTLPEFAARLRQDGVTVRPNIASTGHVSGLSFEAGPHTFRGGQLGRDYTWRALQRASVSYDKGRDESAVRDMATVPAVSGALWSRDATQQLAGRLAAIRTPRGRAELASARRGLTSEGEQALAGTANVLSLLAALRSPAALTRRALSLLPGGSELNQVVSVTQALRSPSSALSFGLRATTAGLHAAAARFTKTAARREPLAAVERRILEAYVRTALADRPGADLLERRLNASGITIAPGPRPLLVAGDQAFTGEQIGLKRAALEPFEGIALRDRAPQAFVPNHKPPVSLSPAERTPFALDEHLRALGSERVDLIVRPRGNAHDIVRPNLSSEEIRTALPWLRQQNAAGAEILLAPQSQSQLQVLSGVTAENIRSATRNGFSPAAVVETAPQRFEVWVRHAAPPGNVPLDEAARQVRDAPARLAYSLKPYTEGTSAPARAAGFTSGEGLERPYAKLHHADPTPAPRSAALQERVLAETQRQDAVLQSVLRTHRVQSPSVYHARFPQDVRVADAAFVRDAVAARMPHHNVVEALSRHGARALSPPEVQLSYAARHLAVALQHQGASQAQALASALTTAAKTVSVVGTMIQLSRFAVRLVQDFLHDRGR
ncbi:MAG: relaxase/mobilization nuclease domain-containing protein [Acidobacteriota bacterium]